MNCPLLSEQNAELLLAYSAGRLQRGETAMLEEHMRRCTRCAEFRLEQNELWTALDLWEPPPVSVSFNRQLWQKIDQTAGVPWYRRLGHSLRSGVWKPAFPLAAAAVVIAAGFMLDHRSTPPAKTTGANGASVSITEADQVEKTLDDIQLLRQLDAAARPM